MGQTSVHVREIWTRENYLYHRCAVASYELVAGLIGKLYQFRDRFAKKSLTKVIPDLLFNERMRIIVLFSSADDSLVKIPLAHFYCLPKKVGFVQEDGCQR